MIAKLLLIAAFSLIKEFEAAVASLDGLNDHVNQLSVKELRPVKAVQIFNSPVPFEEIIEQGDALYKSTLGEDLKAIAKKLDSELCGLLNLGASPLDVAPIINSFFFDAKELVLAAKEIQAYTLLKILQIIYIWRDDAQFHWFQAMSYLSPWYEEVLWNTHSMNWVDHSWAICKWDNSALAEVVQGELSGDDLRIYRKELLMFCAKYDAVNVFKSTRIDLDQLEKYLRIMAEYGSVALLRLYLAATGLEHLHLEEYPLPAKLPASVSDFAFLMDHGHDCFSMSQFIERFCKEGRLDLLLYLSDLEPELIPSRKDLTLAAKGGWLNIIQWAHKLGLVGEGISQSLAVELGVNNHIEALDWLLDESNIIINENLIERIVLCESLKALCWIYKKRRFEFRQEWVDMTAIICNLPTLKWIYKKFRLLPRVHSLKNATIEMLEWIKDSDKTLINADLIEYGAGNFKLLQWALENIPRSVLDEKKLTISLNIRSKEMMEWAFNELRICPAKMEWAYLEDNLEAIQWALSNCQILPTAKNIIIAMKKGSLETVKWIHENHPDNSIMPEALKEEITFGCPKVFNFAISNFATVRSCNVKLCDFDEYDLDTRLRFLSWGHENNHSISRRVLSREIDIFASSGQLQPFLKLIKIYPNVYPSPDAWNTAASHGHHEMYLWILENCPKATLDLSELSKNIQVAFSNGHLEIVTMLIQRYPQLFDTISELGVTKLNYHVKRWLITKNIKSVSQSSIMHSWFQPLVTINSKK